MTVFDLISTASIESWLEVWGLWALFALVMVESVGVPVPGETALIATALYAGTTHQIGVGHVIVVAAIAAITGDNLGYLIGRWIGLPLLERHGRRVGLDASRLKIGRYLFLRHGGKIVFFGRFVAFLRVFAAILAGANRMPWSRFLMMNALGAVCWASLVGLGAYLFGEEIQHVARPVAVLLGVVALAAVVAGGIALRRNERHIQERADAAFPD